MLEDFSLGLRPAQRRNYSNAKAKFGTVCGLVLEVRRSRWHVLGWKMRWDATQVCLEDDRRRAQCRETNAVGHKIAIDVLT